MEGSRSSPRKRRELKSSWTSTRELRGAVTHISEESFKCQLCRLSILMEFLPSVVFTLLELLELPVRCMKPMLYHFFDFSNELSCGFAVEGFFGLFSGCGCSTEPSLFVLFFSTEFWPAHSSLDDAGAVTSAVSSGPAEFFLAIGETSTSSTIFDKLFAFFSFLFFFFTGSLSRLTPHHKREKCSSISCYSLLNKFFFFFSARFTTRHWSYLNRFVLVPFFCAKSSSLSRLEILAIKKSKLRELIKFNIIQQNYEIDSASFFLICADSKLI